MTRNQKPIHFHSSDERHCGARHQFMQFTTDDGKVTCERCLGNVRLFISDQGMQTLRELGYVTADGKVR